MVRIRFGEIAILLASIGVTLSAAVGSAGLYYLSVSASASFAAAYIVQRKLFAPTGLAFFAIVWLLGAAFIRAIETGGESDPVPELLRISAIFIVLLLCVVAAGMQRYRLQMVAGRIAIAHIVILIVALATTDVHVRVISGELAEARFETGGIETAAWAEVSLGAILAAILAGRFWIVFFTIPVAVYTILAADMRTTLLSAVAAFIIMAVGRVTKIKDYNNRIFVIATAVIFLMAISMALWLPISRAVSSALLLDDAHRGLSSGFSGRFDNFSTGWGLFWERPLLGFGFSNSIVNYTHNGYILTLAQMGAVLGAIFIILLLRSGFLAARGGDYILFSCIIALSLFYVGQPRNINFQLCPLIGLLASAHAFGSKLRPQIARGPGMKA